MERGGGGVETAITCAKRVGESRAHGDTEKRHGRVLSLAVSIFYFFIFFGVALKKPPFPGKRRVNNPRLTQSCPMEDHSCPRVVG